MNEEYVKHIEEGWNFAVDTTKKIMMNKYPEHAQLKLTLSIFDKCLSPYHYFMQNKTNDVPTSQPPSEKQIAYAKQLGIAEPEKYNRKELSEMIDEAKKQR